jgi:hypothetical protein
MTLVTHRSSAVGYTTQKEGLISKATFASRSSFSARAFATHAVRLSSVRAASEPPLAVNFRKKATALLFFN